MPGRRPAQKPLAPALMLGLLGASALAGAASSCGSERGTAPPIDVGSGGSGGTANPIHEHEAGPPSPDAGGLCGNTIHQIVSDTPNIVFLFDTSGSMATIVQGGHSRYTLVRDAAVGLVEKLGALINPGAARFPANVSDQDQCHAGEMVMPVSAGDDGGPTTQRFEQATLMTPIGGTPLAATLRALTTPLGFVPGRTFVVLATDGAPNCNYDAMCTASMCEPNIEGQCGPSFNCCAANGPAGPSSCVDEQASVEAVQALAAEGIGVYVVGIPGSDAYASVLDDLAIAGGTAKPNEPRYYKVDDLGHLEDVFGSIASIAISCDFDIADPPPDQGMTNVYLDQTILPYGAKNGWTWKSDTVVELHGSACTELKNGKVKQVQIVSGCPTVVK
ncbi:MAG TPA: vWA domain-containing protein [Minicystis sp.]|nr:vWA domain-containing protein [Minicystis sp.]